jgi:hypothetical protein
MQEVKKRAVLHETDSLEPLTVSVRTAQEVLGIRNTKFWLLVKEGRIELAEIGRRRMVVYKSLKALTQREAA